MKFTDVSESGLLYMLVIAGILIISAATVYYLVACSNRVLSDLACEKAEAMGEYVLRLGGRTVPGSSDMGNVSYECPAIQLGFKIGDPPDGDYTSCHTADFCRIAGSQSGIDGGLKFVKVFAQTAVDLMTKPEILEAAKAEFANVGKESGPMSLF